MHIEIEDALSGAAPAEPIAAQRKSRERFTQVAAAILAITTITFAIGFMLRVPKPPQPLPVPTGTK